MPINIFHHCSAIFSAFPSASVLLTPIAYRYVASYKKAVSIGAYDRDREHYIRNKPLSERSLPESSRALSNQPKFWFDFPEMSYNKWNSNRKREQTFGGNYTQSFGISFPGISILFYFHPGIYGSLFGNSIITEMSGNFPPKIAYILSGQKVR